MPYFTIKTRDGHTLKILLDTGSNKNYIKSNLVIEPLPNQNIFSANAISGNVLVTHHTQLDIFGKNIGPIKFYVLPGLRTFDAILGNDTLKDLSAVIYSAENYFTLKGGTRIPIYQYLAQNVNNIEIKMDHLTEYQMSRLMGMVNNLRNLFADPDERLPYTTKVVGEIRTTTDAPTYTRNYPYPMALKGVVEDEIGKLLRDGIIRPSRSPYNSPIWVVPKKDDSSGRKKYRMVVDFRKLNAITIADRYPIPEVGEVLSRLGGNKYFTVIDLKSGFHQIPLRKQDIEKTAFSVNNGKFEFTRLPFGLKNAPSIFQRALDDILRDYIGKTCYVYIDDIVIFSKDEQSHFCHLEEIFKTLDAANMKIQLDKCDFFKTEVEFLGFSVNGNGVKMIRKKVDAIINIPYPNTLRQLRSFLGLCNYYRRFIQGYADIAKPLTAMLRGTYGSIPRGESSKVKIILGDGERKAVDDLKNALLSGDVMLHYPDYEKEFHLNTDASDVALGAVLSQGGRPITFISRVLSETEEHYATNEREMLAIIWALDTLRSYLYGTAKVVIYTDHQPLTYALSNKNNNSKMKRWKAILEEYNYEIKYQPGKMNLVADALSRTYTTNINSLSGTVHSHESSAADLVHSVEAPINAFKNQIFLFSEEVPSYQFKIVFPGYHRHIIVEREYTRENLIKILKKYMNPSVKNCIKAPEFVMGKIQEFYPDNFRNYKSCFSQNVVKDVTSEVDQENIIIDTHKRAHRNAEENKKQILEKYYFPGMLTKIKRVVKICTICKKNKYERHPNEPKLNATPIPSYPGQVVHIDIFSTDKKLILTSVDKFSKYAQVRVIKGKSTEDVRKPLRDILFFYGVPKTIVIDNERSLNSASIVFMMQDELNIEVFTVPPYRSEVNGQVERFHSTLAELLRCIKAEGVCRDFEELLEKAVNEYNHSIHSTIGKRPVDIFFGRTVDFSPGSYDRTRQTNLERLQDKQEKDLRYHNKGRSEPIKYIPGQSVFVKINRRLGTKLSERYKEEIVKEDCNTTILTESGRVVHKHHIRN